MTCWIYMSAAYLQKLTRKYSDDEIYALEQTPRPYSDIRSIHPCGTAACVWGHATDVWPDRLAIKGGCVYDIRHDVRADKDYREDFFGISRIEEKHVFGDTESSLEDKISQMIRIAEQYGFTVKPVEPAITN